MSDPLTADNDNVSTSWLQFFQVVTPADRLISYSINEISRVCQTWNFYFNKPLHTFLQINSLVRPKPVSPSEEWTTHHLTLFFCLQAFGRKIFKLCWTDSFSGKVNSIKSNQIKRGDVTLRCVWCCYHIPLFQLISAFLPVDHHRAGSLTPCWDRHERRFTLSSTDTFSTRSAGNVSCNDTANRCHNIATDGSNYVTVKVFPEERQCFDYCNSGVQSLSNWGPLKYHWSNSTLETWEWMMIAIVLRKFCCQIYKCGPIWFCCNCCG